ncbi:MAG TPA: multiheme c-type cytochrome, partial [Candidatus Binatia bacterium]|nr:multiheme c-type cytochrome [Candidatus Binatia bacterium]
MGRRALQKFVIGLCLVFPLLMITVVVGETRSPQQESTGDECQTCHGDIHADWLESMHGQATNNRVFLLEWKKDGSPQECMACHTTGYDTATGEWTADGITCDACHSPTPANHPQDIMPTKGDAEDCGTCHVDTYVQWQVSGHGENDLSCANCHNPHTTEIRAADSQELCRTCHNQESHFYEMTAHAEKGLLCTDCHLRVTDASAGEGHGQRIHTFDVDLRSCTQCHGAEMHYPVQNAMLPHEEEASPTVEPTAAVEPTMQP